MRLVLIIVLILLLVGALPTWPHSQNWGYFPAGGLGRVGDERAESLTEGGAFFHGCPHSTSNSRSSQSESRASCVFCGFGGDRHHAAVAVERASTSRASAR